MSEETKKKMLLVSAILFKYNVPVEEAKMIGSFIEELQQEIKELELIVGLRQKRNLISKFDKEYDEEDKKKNPDEIMLV